MSKSTEIRYSSTTSMSTKYSGPNPALYPPVRQSKWLPDRGMNEIADILQITFLNIFSQEKLVHLDSIFS